MMFVLLVEGKANMKGCGTLSLPSNADMTNAPITVTSRLTSITTANLKKAQIGFDVEGQAVCP